MELPVIVSHAWGTGTWIGDVANGSRWPARTGSRSPVVRKSKFRKMTDSPSPPAVDVQALMREIRARVRGESREREWVRQARRSVPPHLLSNIGRLRSSMATLRSAVDRIGQPPPAPPTFRGRVGAALVRVVQRALFWYTPSVQSANHQILNAMDAHLKATEEILAVLERTNVELARVAGTASREVGSA
jgi:hypothetical protein